MDSTSSPQQRDEQLWKLAKKRAGFKRHLVAYVIINIFLWAIWYFSPPHHYNYSWNFPWPLWTTLGWGVGLAFNYAGAYLYTRDDQAEIEYQKLKNKQS